MKKIIMIIAAVAFLGAAAFASTYPPDYNNQSAVAITAGPALLVEVNTMQSGYKYVIGYKKSGLLAGRADHVNAYVKIYYKLTAIGGQWSAPLTAEKQIKLTPEWNGTGYVSGELSQYTSYGNDGLLFVPASALSQNMVEIEKIELSFNVNGQWDSNYSANYVVSTNTLYRVGERFKSGYVSSNLATDTWNFIVNMMRK